MQIYFSYSLSQSSFEIRSSIFKIVSTLEEMGHSIVPKNLLNKGKTHYKTQTQDEKLKSQEKIRKQKRQSDIIILEVSSSSIGLGQELTFALSINKPVIALYRKNSKPHILEYSAKDLLVLAPYNDKNIEQVVKNSIKDVYASQDVRFNMMIPPKLNLYLNTVAKQKNVSKARFIRRLIEGHKSNSLP